nr:unnamed protein product [Callosobruchus chinensis]
MRTIGELNPQCLEARIIGAFTCTCLRSYRSKTALNRHVRYDCGKPPAFRCHVEGCMYNAYQKVHLTRHLLKSHNIECQSGRSSFPIKTESEVMSLLRNI